VVLAFLTWLWVTVRRRRSQPGPAAPEVSPPVAAFAPEPPEPAVPAAIVDLPAEAPGPPDIAVGAAPAAAVFEAAAAPAAAPAAAAPVSAAGTRPALEFELTAIGDRRLRGRVRLLLRPDGVGLAGTWIRARADRLERVAGVAATTLMLIGLGGILLLTTIPGFRFYRLPWLLPSAVAAAAVLAVALLLLGLWRSRQRWSGVTTVSAEMLVGVRRSFNRGPLVAACILLTPLGGALYAALVGPTVVRLRGPFDPDRSVAVEIRLRCRDRDEASDIVARISAIRHPMPTPEVRW
jgi:hypothetical protein